MQRLMPAFLVEEVQVGRDGLSCFRHGVVSLQVYLCIFEAPPQALHQPMVDPPALASPADAKVIRLQRRGERRAGERAALIRMEAFRVAVCLDGGLQRFDAAPRLQAVGERPGEYLAGVPIHDGHQIQAALRHREVGHSRRPDRLGAIHDQSLPEVRVPRMTLSSLAQVPFRVQRRSAPLPHQSRNLLALDGVPEHRQPIPKTPGPRERTLPRAFIEFPHQLLALIENWVVLQYK